MRELIEIIPHGEVVEVAFNRPEIYNASDLEMITSLAQHLTRLATDGTVKGIVLAGRGKVFCAGGDLKWVVQYHERYGSSFHTLAAQFHLAVVEIRRMEKPVVAAINGIAAGGGFSLALACDFRVMEKSAVLKQAYTSNGLCIDGGGSFTLPRIVGIARAMEIMAFDEPITAEQALNWGLATKVVEEGKAVERAVAMLNRLSHSSISSFGWSKRLITDSFNHAFEAHIELERKGLSDCADHPNGREGLRAFSEKRKPRFEG